MAEEWVNRVRNGAKNEINLRLKTKKVLGAMKEALQINHRGEGEKVCSARIENY